MAALEPAALVAPFGSIGSELGGSLPTDHAAATTASVVESARVSCRVIQEADIAGVVDLLHQRFPKRTRTYWVRALQRLADRIPPDGFPRFGYLLGRAERIIGVLLLISSEQPGAEGPVVRCNLSSWCLLEEAQVYAPLLVLRAIKKKPATYTNTTPRTETLPIIEAQGFRRYNTGVFAGVPAFSRAPRDTRISAHPEQWQRARFIQPNDERLLADHRGFGCISLWCDSPRGGQPFVFRRRFIRPGAIPAAQLIYCKSLEDLEMYAGAVGRWLARIGLPLTLVPSDRPLRGVRGRYFPDKLPLYFKGSEPPAVCDLAYSEAALLGL